MNYWLQMLAYLVGGMTLKWLLDLFFLRAHLARLERQASTREAEYIALKHDHSRALTELRNKLTELDATTKAKTLAEGNLAKRDSDLTALRSHLTLIESGLEAGRIQETNLRDRLKIRDAELATVARTLERAQAESRESMSAQEDLRLRLAEATALAHSHSGSLDVARAELHSVSQIANTAQNTVAQLEREIASQQSVTSTLSVAVRSRDAQIRELQHCQSALETERQSVATSLLTSDHALTSAQAQIEDLKTQLHAAGQTEVAHDQEATRLRRDFGAIQQARTVADAALKQREIEVAEWERKATEFQRLAEEAATEHQRVLTELTRVKNSEIAAEKQRAELSIRLETAVANLVAVQRRADQADALETERAALATELKVARATSSLVAPAPTAATPTEPHLAQRVHDLEAEIEAVSISHARLEAELSAERQRAEGLEAHLLTSVPTSSASLPPSQSRSEAQWLTEMDELNRERNSLAAELAAIKAAHPPAPASSRKKAKAASNPMVDLFATSSSDSGPATVPALPTPADLAEQLAPPTLPDGPATEEAVTEFSTRCPQHLSDVKGIGSVFEQRLYAAGVGSFWELSQLPDRTLGEVLELDEPQRERFDFSATRADAARLARETRGVGRKWTGDPPDDLEPLEGIGPVYEQKLYHAGICTYTALAAATPELLSEICPGSHSKKPEYARWIQQARQLIGGEEN